MRNNGMGSLGAASAAGADGEGGDIAEAEIFIMPSLMDVNHGAVSQIFCDADLIRTVFPRDTMKHLARMLNAPLDTARHFLYRRLSTSRRVELAEKLLAELRAQEQLRDQVRDQLLQICGDAMVRAGGGVRVRADRLTTRRSLAG